MWTGVGYPMPVLFMRTGTQRKYVSMRWASKRKLSVKLPKNTVDAALCQTEEKRCGAQLEAEGISKERIKKYGFVFFQKGTARSFQNGIYGSE